MGVWMPFAPPTRCRVCLVKCRSALCPACAAVDAAKRSAARPDRGSEGRRGGYDHAWRVLSKRARELQPWCSRCGATEDLTTDHKDPTKRTGLTLDDVEVLCRRCNSSKGG